VAAMAIAIGSAGRLTGSSSRRMLQGPRAGGPIGGARQPPPHDHAIRRVESPAGFAFNDRAQYGAQFMRRNDLEAKPLIERHVPGNIAERREGDGSVSGCRRPCAYRRDQAASEAAPAVIGMDVNLLEVRVRGFAHLHVRKSDWSVVRKRDPQTSVTPGRTQHIKARCLVENGRRGVTAQELGGGKLDGREQREIGRARAGDCVTRPRRGVTQICAGRAAR
jgi:hypothetical protein